MYFVAELNKEKYEITVQEQKHTWEVSYKLENSEWVHNSINKDDYKNLDGAISFLFDNSSYLVDVVHDGIESTVYTRGTYRSLKIYNEERLLHESLKKGGNLGGSDNLAAGMPGKIVKVFVKAGDDVKTGDPLLVMEAMKMENELRASEDLNIKKVHVKEGDSVEGGAILVSFK